MSQKINLREKKNKLKFPILINFSLIFSFYINIFPMKPVYHNFQNQIMLPVVFADYSSPTIIYNSSNMQGHSVFAECNPGNTSNCYCTQEEAKIMSYSNYGSVIANPNQIGTYVNAIGYKKFTETYPNGQPITLGKIRYRGFFRLPLLPEPEIAQKENPQAVHFMIQFWDGRDSLMHTNQTTREGTIYWGLNPWDWDQYGKIKIYVNPLYLIETGIHLTPDIEWHEFELTIDLENQTYVSIRIDTQSKSLFSYELAQVEHPDWGSDLSLSITTESMASWPGESCDLIFTWTTEFKDLTVELIK